VGHVTQRAERAEILAVAKQDGASVRGAGRDRQRAQGHGHQHGLHSRLLSTVAQSVTVLDMAGLVGDHAQ